MLLANLERIALLYSKAKGRGNVDALPAATPTDRKYCGALYAAAQTRAGMCSTDYASQRLKAGQVGRAVRSNARSSPATQALVPTPTMTESSMRPAFEVTPATTLASLYIQVQFLKCL